MLKEFKLLSFIKYALLATVLFMIGVYSFITNNSYNFSWKLYLGNILFAVGIAFFILFYFRKNSSAKSTRKIIFSALITSIMGAAISTFVCTFILLILMPGFHNNLWMYKAPAQMQQGIHNGLIISLLFSSSIGNISTGAFISVLLPFTTYRKTKDNQAG